MTPGQWARVLRAAADRVPSSPEGFALEGALRGAARELDAIDRENVHDAYRVAGVATTEGDRR